MPQQALINRVAKAEERIMGAETRGARAVFGICDLDRNVIRRLHDGGDVAFGEPDILIPEKLEKLLYPKANKIIYGGRGSAKTRTVAAILAEQIRHSGSRVFCLREIMKSIEKSSHQELRDAADRRKMIPSQIYAGEKVFRSKVSRGRAIYSGMHRNLTEVKGTANIDRGWVEEAENVPLPSWDVLTPTVVRKPGSELIITFNPRFEYDPTWTEWVAPYKDQMIDGVYEDESTLVIECNWRDNPWFTEELRVQKDRMKERDHDRYLWIWEGKFNKKSDEQVLGGKYEIADFSPSDDWEGPFLGADFGFSQDPSTLVKSWIHDETLYIEREAHGVRIEQDEYGEFYKRVPGVDNNKIWADGARPETISHIKRKFRYNIEAADKWPGSVEDGIAHLRGYKKIVIHPRCKYATSEAVNYKHKVDPLTGDITTAIIDDHNHIWDAVRYSLNTKIKQVKRGFFSK